MRVVDFFVVSLDTAQGSGADWASESRKQTADKCKEFLNYLTRERIDGTVTVSETQIPEDDWNDFREDQTFFFDNIGNYKLKRIYSRKISRRGMKSKNELVRQINRICRNFPEHRLYNKAQSLVLLYNHNMSESADNNFFWRNWQTCNRNPERKQEAEHWLKKMGDTKYHKDFYTKKPVRK